MKVTALKFFWDIVKAMMVVHDKHLIHRDLKVSYDIFTVKTFIAYEGM